MNDAVAAKEPPPAADERTWTNAGAERLVRRLPIRWRILSIAGLNTAAVLILAVLIWNGADTLSTAWQDVRQVRDSDKLLTLLESEAGRLQNLIHRYINQPSPEQFAEILLLREAVLGTLRTQGSADPMLADSVDELAQLTERFFDGFGDLRTVQATIALTYEDEILKPAKEMAGLYAIIESAARRDALIWPALGKSREAFTATLVAANAYYLSLASDAAEDARKNIETIEQTVPVMNDLSDSELQRNALRALGERAAQFRAGMTKLTEHFATRTNLLRTGIDANQAAIMSMIDQLSTQMRDLEQQAQSRFDRTLRRIYRQVAVVAAVFAAGIIFFGFLITRSIRAPLYQIMNAMRTIVAGDYRQEVQGTAAKDEIGAMARAVAVFRENAIAKQKAENELRTSKEAAENALQELRAAQRSLIDAEKLAALGGLVAGVAHEVNNPVGISLTVASALARRCDMFEEELKQTQLRRSRLEEFISVNRDASQQLVANLQRAAELIQSFKQVAADRSHAERRQFDLAEATEQIAASLRPAMRKALITLTVDVPQGIMLDSYPGSYGQVLTNLLLNTATHAYPQGQAGTASVVARKSGGDAIELVISDDGVGMTTEVQRRAFDPFYTTRRHLGGTGLGLHIVHNIVTQRLGGKLVLDSRPGQGTTFRITLPHVAPQAAPELSTDGQ